MVCSFRLIATDLDGTLLRADLSVSDRTRRALELASARGIATAFVTARPPRAIRSLAADLGLQGVAICSNGAILYDLARDEIVLRRNLPSAVAEAFAHAIRAADPLSIFGAEYGDHVRCEAGFPGDGAFREVAEDCIVSAADLWRGELVKLVIHHPHHPIETLVTRIAQRLEGQATVTHSGAPFAEITALGVSKADGLMALCGLLGVAPEAVLAFGDMPNDIPLLKAAGHGVAVANAHADVRNAADEVTASNEEDGVARVLERVLGL